MKILHIWDQAGVACVLAKWQRKAGHEAHVIKKAGNDPFGFLDFYGERRQWLSGLIPDCDLVGYDVYHLHSYRFISRQLRERFPKSKIILEYHGTDARGTSQSEREVDESVCDLILYSTPDLIEWVPNGIWLPLPIDIDHFKPTKHKDGALFMKSDAYNLPSELPFGVTVRKPVSYSEVPRVFEDYETYVDIQNHKENKRPVQAHSKTALEALATGMRVYTYDEKFIHGLPSWHRPEQVIKRLDYLYSIA